MTAGSPRTAFSTIWRLTLRPYQQRAVDEALFYPQGVVQSPTGSGKTMMGLELIRRCGQQTLVMVHTQGLADQWGMAIKEFLGITPGRIGGGRWDPGDHITVAILQTLSQREDATRDLAQEIGLILVDECHHTPAQTFSRVIAHFPAKFRYGLSATPIRSDGLHVLINRCVGEKLAEVNPSEVQATGSTVPASVTLIETGFDPGECPGGWGEFVSALAKDEDRNRRIGVFAMNQSKKAATLILTDRVEHAVTLASLTGGILVHGQLSKVDRLAAMAAMQTAPLTIGTTGLLGEGLDIPGWQNLIMASPISSETKLRQAIGRVVRPAPGKAGARVFDLVDACGFAGASFKKRRAIYRQQGIPMEWQKTRAAA